MKLFILFTLILFSSVSFAGLTGPQTLIIDKIGCHLKTEVCYVYVDKQVGPDSCHLNSIRWNKESDISGKEIFSLLMAAQISGKRVSFHISNSCFGLYPTFDYATMYN